MRPVELIRSDQAIHPAVLTNQRKRDVTLRPINANDADAIHNVVSNWQVARMLAQIPWPYQKAHARAFAEYVSNATTGADSCYFAIEDGCLNFLGMIGLVELTRVPRVGFILDRRYWGSGIMSQTLDVFCKASFRQWPADRIASGVFSDNTGSLRVHEKCGFRAIGKTRTFCSPRRKFLTHIDLVLNRPTPAGQLYRS